MRLRTLALAITLTSILACSGDDTGSAAGAGGSAPVGFTAAEAEARCNELFEANLTCFQQESIDQCNTCHVECGEACAETSGCMPGPAEFACP